MSTVGHDRSLGALPTGGSGCPRHGGIRSRILRDVSVFEVVAVEPAPSRRAWSAPGFANLWFAGLCWNWARWGIAFLGAYYVNDVTDSPRLVQLTGSALWAPLLFGGILGGVIADRFDRLRTIRAQLIVLIPMLTAIGVSERFGELRVWMIYPFLVLAGVGWVGDMTSRRSLIYELVGPSRVDHAMGVEMASTATGVAVGNLLGGALAESLGVGGAFLLLAVLMTVGLVALAGVSRTQFAATELQDRPGVLTELREAVGLARGNRQLRSILGVTVLANFFVFAYFPVVQRVGGRLDASPAQIGLLASMTGFGMMVGSWVIIRYDPRWRGLMYAGGVAVGMVMLIPFATAPTLWMACLALFLANCGSGFFGSTQSTLVLTAVPDEVRGRAMGLLSMSIGALPVGTFVLGEIAEVHGATTAVLTMVGMGMVAFTLWLTFAGDVLRLSRAAD